MSFITYSVENNSAPSDDKIIRGGVIDFNKQSINEEATHFSVFAKKDNQIICGALLWEVSDALYIDELWCHENYRKQGIGTKIIAMINDVAITKKLPKIFVDTYEFQARVFYEKNGFYCIGIILKYLKNYDRIFLRKDVF